MSDRLSNARDRRSMRMVWKTLRLRHVGMAFFWACSMLTFRSSILLHGAANTPEYETFVVIVSFVANMTALFAIAAWMERDPTTFDRLPGGLFCGSVVAGIVLIALAGAVAEGALMIALLATGALLTGTGYGYFWGSWAEYLGRMHPSRTSFYVPMAFLITAVLFLAISLSAEYLGVPPLVLMVPLPILSFACLRRCHDELPDGRYARSTDSKRYLASLASLVTLIVASLVLSLLFGFVWEITVLSVHSVNEAHQIPLMANLVAAVVLIGLVLYAHKRIDLAMAFRVIVPVIVVLFAVMPFFWNTNPVVLNVIMSTCYGVFDVIIWYMVASTAYDFAVSGFVVGGIVRALSIVSRLVGIGIGYMVMLIPESPSMLIVGVSVGALYALAMLGLFYATRRKAPEVAALNPVAATTKSEDDGPDRTVDPDRGIVEPSPVAATAPNAPREAASAAALVSEKPESSPVGIPMQATHDADSPTVEAIYEMIAEDYSLTRREAEVLPYLARGRSAKVIADALYVSENTIRTHTRRILEKTDLHSKQQVIDLIEQYR